MAKRQRYDIHEVIGQIELSNIMHNQENQNCCKGIKRKGGK